jgi:hypothetical protein
MDSAEPGWGAELTLISAPSSIQRFPPNSTQQSAQQYNQKLNQSSVQYPLMTNGRWNMKMSLQSSNWSELLAIHRALQAFKPVIKENNIKTIQLFSNNATAVYNLNRKAAEIILYKSLIRLLSLTTTMGVTIVAAHLTGIYNDHPDCLSRLELGGDYRVNKHLLITLLDI